MTRIVIVPAGARHAAMHGEQFNSLAAVLADLGYSASVDIGQERRSIEVIVSTYIGLKILDKLSEDAVDAIVQKVKERLRGLRRPQSGEPRRAVLYGRNDEVLREVELDDEDNSALP
jgi:hypothetical protein